MGEQKNKVSEDESSKVGETIPRTQERDGDSMEGAAAESMSIDSSSGSDTGNELPQADVKKKNIPTSVKMLLVIVAIVAVGVFVSAGSSVEENISAELTRKPIDSLTVGLAAGGTVVLHPDTGTIATGSIINKQIFEGLVRFEDTRKIEPLLATSWVNPDNVTWEFDLKENVRFHNGSLLTAEDVAYSIEQFALNEEIGDIFTSTIKEVVAVDDRTVQIITDGPDPLLLNRLASVFIIDDDGTGTAHPDNGTGPYTQVSETEYDETRIELTTFDQYHAGAIEGVQNLTFQTFSDDDVLIAALERREIDVLDSWTSASGVTPTDYAYNSITLTTPKVTYLGVNHILDGSPTKDLKFRQAVYQAIDVEELLVAYDIDEGVPSSQYVTEDIPGYNPAVERLAFNQQASRDLLEELNWDSDKDTVELTYFVIAKDAAENIAKQLDEVGITVVLDEHTEGATIGGKVFGEGRAQMWFGGFTTDLNDAVDAFTFLFDDSVSFSDEDITEQITEASTTVDAATRLSVLQNISSDLADQIGWVPLYSATLEWFLRSDVIYEYEIDQAVEFGVYFAEMYELSSE